MNLNPDIPLPKFTLTASLVFLIIGFLPVFSIIISGVTAYFFGCALDEGSNHPCFVFGNDIGDLLYMGFMIGWFGLFSIPLGLVGSIIFLITESNSYKKKSIQAPMSHKIAKWMLISMAVLYIGVGLIDYLYGYFSYSGFNI